MLDNIEVAILTKVNELADRHGLNPYDFVATVQPTRNSPGSVLSFEVPAHGTAQKEEKFAKMLQALGLLEGSVLKGTDAQVIGALDNALQLAPKARARF